MGKRDFVCLVCQKAFGYKHLLQRHTAKLHAQHISGHSSDEGGDEEGDNEDHHTTAESDDETNAVADAHQDIIDQITGKAYADRTKTRVSSSTAFLCPFPHLDGLPFASLEDKAEAGPSNPRPCDFAFSRVYDLRRHLHATHHLETTKEDLRTWIRARST